MNESKVVEMEIYRMGIKGRLFNTGNIAKDVPNTNFVTHADYKALEDAWNAGSAAHEELAAEFKVVVAELASLKARVRELVEADNQVNVSENAGHSFEDHTAAFIRFRVAMEALK